MGWWNWSGANQLNRIEAKLDALLRFVEGKRPAKSVRLATERLAILTKQGELIMSGSVNVTTDHDERVPLVWKDDVGVVSAPTTGTTAASSDPSIVASVDVAADDQSIVLRTAGAGQCTVTVTNGSMTDTITVNVAAPQASSLSIDATDATMVAKGTAA